MQSMQLRYIMGRRHRVTSVQTMRLQVLRLADRPLCSEGQPSTKIIRVGAGLLQPGPEGTRSASWH